MNKKILKQLEEKLEKQKINLEKELRAFAKKDEKLEGDWDTRYPRMERESGGTSQESEADEVEEYSSLLPIEFNLEKRLVSINKALEKIKKGKYGICEECKKEISIARLKALPAAETCRKCKK